MTDTLEHLDERDGFRIRGAGMTRLETFVDAAFAFALTLLVISFDNIPSSMTELAEAMRGIPAFAASFALICMFWVGHRQWSQWYGLEDSSSTLISFGLVFVVLIYVFPLRVMTAAAMNALTGGWAPSDFVMTSFEDGRSLLVIYGSGFAAANFCLVLLHLHALRVADRLSLNAYERFVGRATAISWSIVGAAGLASVVLALALPDRKIWLASWFYFSLAFVMPLYGFLTDRRAERYRTTAE
jgi:uncharacterized membrane protein